MAKKPESDSFIDLFAQFGRDLKMPSIDIDRIIEHHRKNLETLEKTAKAATAGASSVMAKQREILEQDAQAPDSMIRRHLAERFVDVGRPRAADP